jgi:hypothetical protein
MKTMITMMLMCFASFALAEEVLEQDPGAMGAEDELQAITVITPTDPPAPASIELGEHGITTGLPPLETGAEALGGANNEDEQAFGPRLPEKPDQPE